MASKPLNITISNEIQRMLPPGVRRKAGFKAGDALEVKAVRGIVTLINKSPAVVEDEYTPEQRRAVDARIAAALEDVKHGRVSGPFETHAAMMAHLKKSRTKPKASRKR